MRVQLLIPFLIAVAFWLSGQSSAAASGSPAAAQVIEVTAKKYEFSPSPIRVKQGTKVQLKITATDHVHGFRIATIPDGGDTNGKPGLVLSSGEGCNRIEKGQTATIEFVAQTPGTYPFKCCVHCGWHHRSMHSELIVEP
jgi:heme/copper-type cytochrome/quinol oxidase subunit 2